MRPMVTSSRTAVIALLIAVEIAIAGMVVYAVTGSHGMGASGGASPWKFGMGGSQIAFKPVPIAAIAAGNVPTIRIDDPDSTVTVDTSSDGKVHVQDTTSVQGMVWSGGTIPQLRVVRTADGVSITRPAYSDSLGTIVFGGIDGEIHVDVPPGSRLWILHCSAAEINGIQNDVDVASQDGHVSLAAIRGNVNASSDDGHIDARDVRGDRIAISSGDGHLSLTDISASSLEAKTTDGRIDAQNLTIAGSTPHLLLHSDDGSVVASGAFAAHGAYEISSLDGSITLTLAPGSNAAVDATTDDGSVTIDGARYEGDDATQHSARVGDASSTMLVRSNDGSIHITTNEAQ